MPVCVLRDAYAVGTSDQLRMQGPGHGGHALGPRLIRFSRFRTLGFRANGLQSFQVWGFQDLGFKAIGFPCLGFRSHASCRM